MKLFISYARVDVGPVTQVVDILRSGGHDPWFDHRLEKRVEKEQGQTEKALQHLMNKDYGCEDAICKAVNALKATWQYREALLDIRTETRYKQRGRPR